MSAPRAPRSHPVVVIGLDACDPDLVERWIKEGRLPFLRSLVEAGVWARLRSYGNLFSDSPWPSFAAGVSPAKHGFYNSQHIKRGTTDIETTRAAFGRYLPFWWMLRNSGKKALVFDVPKTAPIAGVDGVQVASWGEHFGLFNTSSLPPALADEVQRTFGKYRHASEIIEPKRVSQELRLHHTITRAVEHKLRVAQFLLKQDAWDLFVSVFAESHYGGHQFLHRSDNTHWAHHHSARHHLLDESLPAIYSRLDAAVAELFHSIPADATLFVVSVHGIETNFSANHLVPAVLEGLGLQVRPANLATGGSGRGNVLSTLRSFVPGPLRDLINSRLPQSTQDKLFSRMFSARIDWKRTQAFSLPSGDFQGFISINLHGREPWGTIRPGAEYRELCERIRYEMKRLINPATGRPAVEEVVLTAQVFEGENLYELADLVIQWSKDAPIHDLHHPDLGTISGSAVKLRRAQHAPQGFMIASGAHISRGAVATEASILDLAPTILYLMGQPVPRDADGRVLLEIIDPDFKAHSEVRFENRPLVVPETMRL